MTIDPESVSQGSTFPAPPQISDIPANVPVLPLDGVVLFPLMIAPVVVNDTQSKDLVESVMRGDRLLALFHPKGEEAGGQSGDGNSADGVKQQLHPVGTLCSVLRMLRIPDGSIRLLLHGVCRVELDRISDTEPFLRGDVEPLSDKDPDPEDIEVEAMMKLTLENIQQALNLNAVSEELMVAAMNTEGPGKMADLVASNLQVRIRDLIPVLAEMDTKRRLAMVLRLLGREVHVMEIGTRINNEVRDEVDKSQRSFFLHQQMKAIRKELGESDPHEAELSQIEKRLKTTEMPAHARKVADRELGRLQALPPQAAEYGVIRTYLDWILEIPWSISSDDHIDIDAARRVLDEDHYGLEKVKERILEFLSVIRLKGGDLKGPILCLVGPPGVGKTSLGRSVARATGRQFQNFSLGGMRDEAEIRGHRRTYVGAMPGRIIKSLKDAGTNNPLIMLDEVDKLGSDFRGDPASALLEVLDPEQNYRFSDHYLDMPVDLSRVMFITTANTLDSIPDPLRDRMEIIRLAGYTEWEKQEIASRYLIPREIDNAGLLKKQLSFTKPGIRRIIRDYTAEAGVRGLQREIAKVCRKVAMRVAEYESAQERRKNSAGQKARNGRRAKKAAEKPPAKPEAVKIVPENLEEFLGAPRAHQEVAERTGRPGIAIGLAWTSIGGAILFIEAARYPGKGELKLTGQLGNVMKESGSAALTWLRANAEALGLDAEEFSKWEYHVHVPAGATPKDGPSAGVAIAVALASLLTGKPVRDYLAMTGEITLRGNVMPVGGIKEKALAAHRAGIKRLSLPKQNENDFLEEVPARVKKAVKVSYYEEALPLIQDALR